MTEVGETPPTGNKSTERIPVSHPVEEGKQMLLNHIRSVVAHIEHYSSWPWPAWMPRLLILNKDGALIPSYGGSIFVPDKKGLETEFRATLEAEGFKLKSVQSGQASWQRDETKYPPTYIQKDGKLIVPNLSSYNFEEKYRLIRGGGGEYSLERGKWVLKSTPVKKTADMKAELSTYEGPEITIPTGPGEKPAKRRLYITETVYDDGRTKYDQQGNITEVVGRHTVYRIHAIDPAKAGPASIPPEPPSGTRWAQVPTKSLR